MRTGDGPQELQHRHLGLPLRVKPLHDEGDYQRHVVRRHREDDGPGGATGSEGDLCVALRGVEHAGNHADAVPSSAVMTGRVRT